MKVVTKVLLGFAGLIAAGKLIDSASASSDDGGGGGGNPNDTTRSNRQQLWDALMLLPLDDTQRLFLMLTAYGESRYDPRARNDSASEVLASAKASSNNPDIATRAAACGVPEARLRTGSWGRFQRLAPYLSNDAYEIFGQAAMCGNADPTASTADFQIASALETAGDLQQYNGWKANPTVGNLRLGWAAPALMGYLSKNKAKLDKYRRHAKEDGLPAGLVERVIAPFPRNVAAMYAMLRAVPG